MEEYKKIIENGELTKLVYKLRISNQSSVDLEKLIVWACEFDNVEIFKFLNSRDDFSLEIYDKLLKISFNSRSLHVLSELLKEYYHITAASWILNYSINEEDLSVISIFSTLPINLMELADESSIDKLNSLLYYLQGQDESLMKE